MYRLRKYPKASAVERAWFVLLHKTHLCINSEQYIMPAYCRRVRITNLKPLRVKSSTKEVKGNICPTNCALNISTTVYHTTRKKKKKKQDLKWVTDNQNVIYTAANTTGTHLEKRQK